MASTDDAPGSSTQKRYLHIDSSHYRPPTSMLNDVSTLNSGELDVILNEPIVDAHEVSLLSMTVPNEFFNVREGANKLIHVEHVVGQTGATFTEIEVPVGAYTIEVLVRKLTEQLVIQTVGSQVSVRVGLNNEEGVDDVKPFLAGIDIVKMWVIGSASNATQNRVAFLAHPGYENPFFRNSILHRLGFTQAQVPVLRYKDNIADIRPVLDSLVKNERFMMFNKVGTVVQSDNTVAKNSGPKYASFVGHESYDNLRINLDLVGGGMQTTTRTAFGVETRRNDILAIVPLATNLGSLGTYKRPNKGHMNQTIHSRRPVDRLRITLTDDNGIQFKAQEHPDFSIVLEFTVVEQVPKIGADVKAANQHKAFLSRHMPIQLQQ